ncbi:MAG: ribonuclease E/G [Kiloniellaceae bacterium]
MSVRLLISALPGETRAAWVAEGRLRDLVVLRDDRPWIADNIYCGRIQAVDKGLAGAFVDIGCARPGFLPLGEGPKGLSQGDAVIVRVKREPGPDKGARLTARFGELPPDVAAAAQRARPPALLRRAADPIVAALGLAEPPAEIVIDDPAAFAEAKQALGPRPDLLARLKLDLDPAPLFEREGIEEAIEALLEARAALPSGGSLLIEPVQSLTAIDVNSARHGGAAKARALDVNLEAAAEIPRQLRLRALSGLIVVDFLELGEAAARQRVVEELQRGLKDDPAPCRVFPMSASGLVEMTRRRSRPALHEILTEPCGVGGRVKDPVTLAYQALRAVRRAARGAPGHRVSVSAAPGVVAALEGPAKPARAALEGRLGRPIELRAERHRDGFEIVLD